MNRLIYFALATLVSIGALHTQLAADEVTPLQPLIGASRTLDSREAMLKKYGGSEKSEQAVSAALKWLAEHQLADGGWSFKHQGEQPGSTESRNAATGVALLAFLGAGNSHKGGQYRKAVSRGIDYLVKHAKSTQYGLSWSEQGGTMYAHGIALQALVEAWGMTRDVKLRDTVQRGVNFTVYAQDPVGGGWRYMPKMPGDTSVSSWQLVSLHLAETAGAIVPKTAFTGAADFLDSVQSDEGAFYGYTRPARSPATTAAGLYCRIHGGWTAKKEALKRGVGFITKLSPSQNNMYQNYYAANAIFHAQQKGSGKWLKTLRDYLVQQQSQQGPTAGSWHFSGGHTSERGGRLLNTALATLILEIYYRHGPMLAD